MDSIMYFVDPYDKKTRVSIFDVYPRYTMEMVEAACIDQTQPFDQYDTQNDKCAQEFLFRSLIVTLEKELRCAVKDEDAFPVAFMPRPEGAVASP